MLQLLDFFMTPVRIRFARFAGAVDQPAGAGLAPVPGLRRVLLSPLSSFPEPSLSLSVPFTARSPPSIASPEAVGDLQRPFFGVARPFAQQPGAVGGAGEAAADLRDAVRGAVEARAEAVQFVELAALLVACPQFVAGVLQRRGLLRHLFGADHRLHRRVFGDLALPLGQLRRAGRVRSSSRLRSRRRRRTALRSPGRSLPGRRRSPGARRCCSAAARCSAGRSSGRSPGRRGRGRCRRSRRRRAIGRRRAASTKVITALRSVADGFADPPAVDVVAEQRQQRRRDDRRDADADDHDDHQRARRARRAAPRAGSGSRRPSPGTGCCRRRPSSARRSCGSSRRPRTARRRWRALRGSGRPLSRA